MDYTTPEFASQVLKDITASGESVNYHNCTYVVSNELYDNHAGLLLFFDTEVNEELLRSKTIVLSSVFNMTLVLLPVPECCGTLQALIETLIDEVIVYD